jgi:PAS domain S-box-containing protein
MISATAALPSSYDYGEVARSVLIAIAASYAALDLAGRVTAARGQVRLAWLSGGAVAMGVGIWTMHLKAMLAFRLPVPVEYHWPTVLLALWVAICASAVALYVTSREKMGQTEALTGSIVMGAGIAGLHYILMAAMRLPATAHYSPLLVTCSIFLAILFSLIALLMAFGLREETKWSVLRRLGSALVMGVAVSVMHYTGMAAATFFPASPPDLSHTVSNSPVGGFGVVIATLIVLAAAITTSSIDRRAHSEIQRLNQDLERRVGDRTAQLRALNEKLADSEERFRKLMEALPDGVLVHGENKILFVNPSCMRLLGAQQPEQLLGVDVLDILRPDYREAVQQCIHFCLKTGTACPAKECVFLALDGSEVQIEAAAIAVPWKGSQAVEVIVRDIRERKRAEDRLREYEKVVEGLEEMIVVVDRDYRYVLANRAFLSRHGLERKELLGRSIVEVLDEKAFDTVVKGKLDECFQGRTVTYEMKYDYPKLGERDLLIAYFPIEGPAGIDRAACVVQDITVRKQAEQSLRLFRLLIDQSNDAIEVIDPVTLRFVDINERACLDMGYTREEFLSLRVQDIDPTVDESVFTRITGELQNSGSAVFESLHRRKDGSTFPVEVSIKQVQLDRQYRISVVRDTTERKKADRTIREARAELARVTRLAVMGELTASIAHEINQPLAAVVTNGSASLRWLAAQPPNLGEARTAIEGTIREANRASDVIERIRALLQKTPPRMEILDVNAVVREVLTLADGELSKGGLEVRTDLAADVPAVLGDRVQLRQVMLNLILNSIDAMSTISDRPRELFIRSSLQADGVLIEVHDSGKGVDPEQADRIFESFFTTKPQGTGLGLSLSRSIVESHGGRLWVNPGTRDGAVFQFTIPKADPMS